MSDVTPVVSERKETLDGDKERKKGKRSGERREKREKKNVLEKNDEWTAKEIKRTYWKGNEK